MLFIAVFGLTKRPTWSRKWFYSYSLCHLHVSFSDSISFIVWSGELEWLLRNYVLTLKCWFDDKIWKKGEMLIKKNIQALHIYYFYISLTW